MEKEETKRIVLLGRSSSGKTSVINCLKGLGYQVGHEIPTIVLDSRKTRPLNSEEWETRQKLMYDLQKTLEDSYEGLIFQDRCLIDNYAYSRILLGKIPDYFDKSINFQERYRAVFELENLLFKKTNTRIELDETEAQIIYEKVKEFYLSNRLTPFLIPSFQEKTIEASIKKRAELILSKLEEIFND